MIFFTLASALQCHFSRFRFNMKTEAGEGAGTGAEEGEGGGQGQGEGEAAGGQGEEEAAVGQYLVQCRAVNSPSTLAQTQYCIRHVCHLGHVKPNLLTLKR